MANPVLGHYPMTIAQLGEWARQSSCFSVAQCAILLRGLDRRTITIRKV